MPYRRVHGFTLAELLIALVILGVIATFTIPKVLTSQQASSNKTAAKEVAGMISGAFQAYEQANGGKSSTMGAQHLTPYMNYVKVDTSTSVNEDPADGGGALQCSNALRCLVLHNGGGLMYDGGSTFGGTAGTNGVWFQFDPDHKFVAGSDASMAVIFWQQYNGRIVTAETISPNICNSGLCETPVANGDPNWFDWN